jgi:hypothetical protein
MTLGRLKVPESEHENRVAPSSDAAVEEAIEFVFGLAEESDRSAVILGAARLDLAIGRLLKQVMHHHPGGSDNLFDQDRPLGTFSAKIALSHRLGLFDHDLEHALQMARRLRNDFAHSAEKAYLTNSPHKDRVRELTKDLESTDMWGEVHQTFVEKVDSKPLADFCTAMAMLIRDLEFGGIDTTVVVNNPVTLSKLRLNQ